jgi:hypothetical protein
MQKHTVHYGPRRRDVTVSSLTVAGPALFWERDKTGGYGECVGPVK